MSLSSVVRHVVGLVGEDLARLTDAELLARADEPAFAALVARHGPAVLGVCRRVLGHADDAEDAAQAVFLVLARNRHAIRNPAALASWLHGVALRVGRKALARRPRVEPLPASLPAAEAPDAASWADARRVIDAALADLPDSLRAPLVLCYLEGLTRDEAADRLGWSPDTLRGRLERGRAKLRALLERRGFPLAAGLLAVLLESPTAASAAWTTSTAAVAAGATLPSPGVQRLSTGVLPVTNPFSLRIVATMCGCGLALGLATATQKPPEPQPHARVEPAARRPVVSPPPRPAAVARVEDLVGVWRAERVLDGGNAVRTEVIGVRRDAGGLAAEWDTRLRSPGVDTNVLRVGPLAVAGDTLEFTTKSRFVGEEQLPVPDARPLVVKFEWVGNDKSAFRLRQDVVVPGGAIFDRTYRKSDEKPAPPDPRVPKTLPTVGRKLKKEPTYVGSPHYLLATFGPGAKFLVWVVKDDFSLYVDRNGNGDLTDDGERFPLGGVRENPPNRPRSFAVVVGDLTDAAGKTTHTDFAVSGIGTSGVRLDGAYLKMLVKVDGKVLQTAGPTDLRMTPSPADARVVPFGVPPSVVRPSLALRTFPAENKAVEFCVQVGTPGLGGGAFAAYGTGQAANGLGPTAEFEFPSPRSGDPAKKLTVHLTERCCGDHFFATVRTPDGVKTGLNAAKVTLSFPACPWGKVEPATFEVDVIPKEK